MRMTKQYLQWAVYYNRLNICRLLLDLGADTNVEDDSGRSGETLLS